MSMVSFLIDLAPTDQEIEMAKLYMQGVESFIEHENALEAFVNSESSQELIKEIEEYLIQQQFSFKKIHHSVKDWNAEWESNFEAIRLGNSLIVRAPFHPQDNSYSYELIISPKMAFGTGHHETTSMILEWMLVQDFTEKKILDFGCGTGILGIFALKKLANEMYFIDNDVLATENTLENLKLNQLNKAHVLLGSFDCIPNMKFDLIFANITRNILSDGLSILTEKLETRGKIILSGFLIQDEEYMINKIKECGLTLAHSKRKKDWLCIIAEMQ